MVACGVARQAPERSRAASRVSSHSDWGGGASPGVPPDGPPEHASTPISTAAAKVDNGVTVHSHDQSERRGRRGIIGGHRG